MKSVLLCGYYGFGNLGDELLLKNIARMFRELGFADIRAVSGDVEYSKEKHPDILFTERNNYSEIVRIVESVDLVALGGGGLFQDCNRMRTAALFESPFEGTHAYANIPLIATIKRKPVAYLFQGIGPLFSQDSRDFTRFAFSLSSVTSVRDTGSCDLACSLGITNVLNAADPVLMYPADTLHRDFRHQRIGISLRQKPDGSLYEEALKAVAHFIDSRQEYEFVFLSFQDRGVWNSDSMIYDTLVKTVKNRKFILVRSCDLSLSEFESLFTTLDYMIGMRLHSLVLSIKYCIPFIAFPYWDKVDYLLSDSKLAYLKVPMNEITAEKIEEGFCHILENRETIKNDILRGLTLLTGKIAASINSLKDFISAESSREAMIRSLENSLSVSNRIIGQQSSELAAQRIKTELIEKQMQDIMHSKTWKLGQLYGRILGVESPLRRIFARNPLR